MSKNDWVESRSFLATEAALMRLITVRAAFLDPMGPDGTYVNRLTSIIYTPKGWSLESRGKITDQPYLMS